ncbi:AAA family ATPase [Paenibacillus piri]|nr:AAA family ATPase [Paenibacillus piri]
MSLNLDDYPYIKWYENGPFTVYRGLNPAARQQGWIKKLTAEYPDPNEIQWMTTEYEQGKRLAADLPLVVKPLRIESYDSTFLLRMEPTDGQPLAFILQQGPLAVRAFLQLAVSIADLLHKLNQSNTVHFNITPHAFIVEPDLRTVKITDLNMTADCSEGMPEPDGFLLFPEGRLPYIAPELTGRMNRQADFCADMYSVGAVFYEMLTGSAPFTAADAAELVHCHLARLPAAPSDISNLIPGPVSDIVMRCLAKQPEQRYPTMFALKRELETYLEQWQENGSLDARLPASASGMLQLSDAMYGREPELLELQNAFRRASHGGRELVLISGMSGVGKTYLIQQFKKSIPARQAVYISGKFEQYNRDTPFQALKQAGRQLIHYVLTLPEYEFAQIRGRIMEAVGSNGQVLIEMHPDMVKIIGEQPPLPKLPPAETNNRFLLTLEQLLTVFNSNGKPLIVFIDDLQWADQASLRLIEKLSSNRESGHCLFIGAYREQDNGDNHPLRLGTELLERLQTTRITLKPLQPHQVEQLLKDTLQPAAGQNLGELSRLLIEKTKGNPFFTKQFIRSMYDRQLLEFDFHTGHWTWNIDVLGELYMSDNVVDLMVDKIRKLSEPVQEMLTYAACIGSAFPAGLLAQSIALPVSRIEAQLLAAAKEGLISALPVTETEGAAATYKFSHDRIHQAVYSLVAQPRIAQLHYRIGLHMLESMDESESQEQLFETTNQLNWGKELLVSERDKDRLIELNLSACRKAKATTAYDTALKYAQHALQLLGHNCWSRQYDRAFAVHLELAELEYLCGRFDDAQRSFSLLLKQSRSKLEQADVYNLMIILYTNLGLHEEALRIGLEGLRMLGMPIRSRVSRISMIRDIAAAKWDMMFRHPEELYELPQMEHRDHRAVMKLMVNLIPPAYFVHTELYISLMLKMFRYSLRHGNSEGSALSYSTYGVISSSIFGKLDDGLRYGRLALRLSDSFDYLPIKSKVYFGHGAFTNNLQYHIEYHIGYLRRAYQIGIEAGDLVYAGYSIAFSFFLRLFKGDALSDIYEESEAYRPFIIRSQDKDTIYILMVLQRFMLFMKEAPLEPQPHNDRANPFFDPDELSTLQSLSNKATIHTYYSLQLLAFYLLEQWEEAKAMMEEAENSLTFVFGLLHVHLYYFISSLIMTALYKDAGKAEQKRYRSRLRKYLKFFNKWSRHSSDNFLHLKLLLEAEVSRIFGRRTRAAELYDEAIACAGKQRFIQYEAMANECAASFYMQNGKPKIAKAYLQEAVSLYGQWGATCKTIQLEERHPFLIGRSAPGQVAIDISTVTKASQVLSSEAVFQKLLESFMQIVIENAGAEKGLLMLMRDNRLYIEAEKMPGHPFIALHSVRLDDYRHAPITAIQYAARTGETVLLHDAALSEQFGQDAFIQRRRLKSLLILPIMKLGQLVGLLYLENNLSSHVFQEQRLDTLKLLAAEIAVTIENSKLHSNLEYKDYKLQLLEEQEKNIRLQLDEKERWVQSSEATMLNIRKSQHELINNVQTVHALLMMNKYDMAKDYISVWCKEIVQQSVVNSVQFPVLGVVLNNIGLSCISRKIDLQVAGKLDCAFDRLTLPISYFSSIVSNLLKNAVEAIPQEDPLRTIRLTIEEDEQSYTLSVFNSGSFIEEQHRHRLFDKGFSTKPDSTNSGLGLHIAQNYLHHYGGSIDCQSIQDSGTTFTVHFMKKQTVSGAESAPIEPDIES